MNQPGAAGAAEAGSARRAVILPGVIDFDGLILPCQLLALGWRSALCSLTGAAAAALAAADEVVLRVPTAAGTSVALRCRTVAPRPGVADRFGEPTYLVSVELLDPAGLTPETMEALLLAGRPRILLLGLPPQEAAICRRVLLPDLLGEVMSDEDELFATSAALEPAVICLGPVLPFDGLLAIVGRFAELYPGARTRVVVSTRGGDLHRLLGLPAADRFFHVAAEPLPLDQLAVLLRAAAAASENSLPSADDAAPPDLTAEVTAAGRIGRLLIGQKDLPGALAALEDRVRDLLTTDRFACLLVDRVRNSFWTLSGVEVQWRESPAVGLVGFVARARQMTIVDRLHEDARFDLGSDEPEAAGDERWLGAPLIAGGEQLIGVLVVLRGGHRPPFSQRDQRLFAVVAEQAATPLAQLARQWDHTRAGGGLQETETQQLSTRLFRGQAIENFRSAGRAHGDPLRIAPEWTRWTYRLLLLALAAALLFASIAPVHQYAAGPGVVQLEGRRALTANTSGTASAVLVEPGEAVNEGQLLVRFYGASEVADLERIDLAFELELIKRLRDPVDVSAERALSNLRAERGLALARLAERDVRAPTAGLVSDVLVRPGQHLTPGQILMTLQTRTLEPQLLAMLPGSQRPLLKPGMTLRFELEGYRYAYQRLEISTVGDQVIGPAEAQRYLGELADAVTIQGPVVFVYARLPGATFEWNDESYRLHDGMWGRAEVPVRSESVLLTMAPILRSVFTSRDG